MKILTDYMFHIALIFLINLKLNLCEKLIPTSVRADNTSTLGETLS